MTCRTGSQPADGGQQAGTPGLWVGRGSNSQDNWPGRTAASQHPGRVPPGSGLRCLPDLSRSRSQWRRTCVGDSCGECDVTPSAAGHGGATSRLGAGALPANHVPIVLFGRGGDEMSQSNFRHSSRTVSNWSRYGIVAAVLALVIGLVGLPTTASAVPARAAADGHEWCWWSATRSTQPIEELLTVQGVPFTPVSRPGATRGRHGINAGVPFRGTCGRRCHAPSSRPSSCPSVVGGESTAEFGASWTPWRYYETTYGIRQLSAYDWRPVHNGLGSSPSRAPLDGKTATVTTAGPRPVRSST